MVLPASAPRFCQILPTTLTHSAICRGNCQSGKIHRQTFANHTKDKGEGRCHFFFIVMYSCKLPARLEPFQRLHTESRLGPIVHKTKVGAYNNKVPWGCRRFWSWKGSATRISCRANPGLWQVLPVGIELSILRPVLVNQSQEYLIKLIASLWIIDIKNSIAMALASNLVWDLSCVIITYNTTHYV